MDAADAACGADVEEPEGAEDVGGVDAEGGVLVVEVHVGAGGEGAGRGEVHAGAVQDAAGGAVGEGAEAGEGGGAVGAGAEVEGAEGESIEVGDAVSADAVVGLAGAGGAADAGGAAGAGGVAGAERVGRVGRRFVGPGEGGGTVAGAGAVHAGAEADGEEHADDTARPHSCQLSASFCFVSVWRAKGI